MLERNILNYLYLYRDWFLFFRTNYLFSFYLSTHIGCTFLLRVECEYNMLLADRENINFVFFLLSWLHTSWWKYEKEWKKNFCTEHGKYLTFRWKTFDRSVILNVNKHFCHTFSRIFWWSVYSLYGKMIMF